MEPASCLLASLPEKPASRLYSFREQQPETPMFKYQEKIRQHTRSLCRSQEFQQLKQQDKNGNN